MAVPNGHSGTLPEQEASSMGKDALPLTQTGNALNLAPLPADGASAAAQMSCCCNSQSRGHLGGGTPNGCLWRQIHP
jgi:hypothetical protein